MLETTFFSLILITNECNIYVILRNVGINNFYQRLLTILIFRINHHCYETMVKNDFSKIVKTKLPFSLLAKFIERKKCSFL